MSHLLRVGLTGGIGSGKSTVADLFAARGASIVDTDLIAHALTAAGGSAMAAIRDEFGAAVVSPSGALDRGEMRRLAFADPLVRGRLEAILHPLIRAESLRQCERATGPYVLLVVPLLVESGDFRRRVDRVLVVDCPPAVQVARVMARSGLSEPEVRAIIAAQVGRDERLAAADDVVVNDGPLAAVASRVDALHQLYVKLASELKASC